MEVKLSKAARAKQDEGEERKPRFSQVSASLFSRFERSSLVSAPPWYPKNSTGDTLKQGRYSPGAIPTLL